MENHGFQAISNTIVIGKEPDIIFKYGPLAFVIEVKVGKKEIISLRAVAQTYDYNRRLETNNVIMLTYPKEIKNSPVEKAEYISHDPAGRFFYVLISFEASAGLLTGLALDDYNSTAIGPPVAQAPY